MVFTGCSTNWWREVGKIHSAPPIELRGEGLVLRQQMASRPIELHALILARGLESACPPYIVRRSLATPRRTPEAQSEFHCWFSLRS